MLLAVESVPSVAELVPLEVELVPLEVESVPLAVESEPIKVESVEVNVELPFSGSDFVTLELESGPTMDLESVSLVDSVPTIFSGSIVIAVKYMKVGSN